LLAFQATEFLQDRIAFHGIPAIATIPLGLVALAVHKLLRSPDKIKAILNLEHRLDLLHR